MTSPHNQSTRRAALTTRATIGCKTNARMASSYAEISDSVHGRQHRTHGFTLVELLVVIAIIGMLIAILLPAVQAAHEAARRSQCLNNFKQVGIAIHQYIDTVGQLPTGIIEGSCTTTTGHTTNDWGWAVYILPYFEQGPLTHNSTSATLVAAVDMHRRKTSRSKLRLFPPIFAQLIPKAWNSSFVAPESGTAPLSQKIWPRQILLVSRTVVTGFVIH